MEGRRHRARTVAAVVGLIGVLSAVPAEARERRTTADATATTSDSGITTEFVRTVDGAIGSAIRGAATSTCEWTATRYSDSQTNVAADDFGERPSEAHELWQVFCDGEYVGTYWLGPSNFGEPAIQPIVDRLVRQVLIDGIEVKTRPDGEGITGIPSLFWVEGYDGEPITATEEAFGLTVTVTAQLQEVEWDFGDGTPKVRAGLGEAWPERSSVRHNYRDRTEPGRPYVVTASLVLDTSFSVNGEPANDLPSITRLGELELHVGEVQAVRNR